MNHLYQNIKNFKKNKIFKKYFKLIFGCLLIPCLLADAVIFVFLSYNNEQKSRNQLTEFTKIVAAKLDNSIDNINKLYNALIANDDVIAYFLQNEYKSDQQVLYYNLANILNYSTMNNGMIKEVNLYNYSSNYVFSNVISGFVDSLPLEKEYYDALKSEDSFICENTDFENNNIISFYFTVELYQKKLGCILINVDKATFMDYISSLSPDMLETEMLLYLPSDDVFIYNESNALYEAVSENIKSVITSKTGCLKLKHGTICSRQLNDVNMYIVTSLNNSSRQMNHIFIIYIALVTLLLVIITFVLSFFSSSVLYGQIINFTEQLENVVLGEAFDIPDLEFTKITDNLLKLRESAVNNEKNLAEYIAKTKKLQTLALQTQISPHFLFNTLNVLSGYIMVNGGSNEETLLISNLADILYYTLNTTNLLVPFSLELECCKKYLEIESIKYKHSFDVEWEIDSDTMSNQVIRMSLQPILENCIKHGIRGLREKRGKITVKTYKKDSIMYVEISNNGLPINNDKLNELNRLISSDFLPEDNHIGLLNVNQRCTLVFGTEYKIKIHSDNNITKFTLKYPEYDMLV